MALDLRQPGEVQVRVLPDEAVERGVWVPGDPARRGGEVGLKKKKMEEKKLGLEKMAEVGGLDQNGRKLFWPRGEKKGPETYGAKLGMSGKLLVRIELGVTNTSFQFSQTSK